MSKNKKLKILILLLMALLIALLVVACCLIKSSYGAQDPTEPSTEPTTEATTEATTEPTTEPTTEATTEETTEATTEATTEPTTEPTTSPTTVPEETKTEYIPPATEAPTEPAPTEPVLTDPAQILSLAKEWIKSLSGDANEVGSVENPKYLTITVSGTEDVQVAAQAIVDKVKAALDYEQSQANPDVAVGNPNPFTYDYALTFVETADGQHTFQFAYHFVSTSYEVSNQDYDTNRLVADVCAYLDSLGKTKFDSQSSEYVTSQPVIVLLEHPYETALSIVTAQVESASSQYREYDFYYAALTVTTKGGVEQQALLFNIVNR